MTARGRYPAPRHTNAAAAASQSCDVTGDDLPSPGQGSPDASCTPTHPIARDCPLRSPLPRRTSLPTHGDAHTRSDTRSRNALHLPPWRSPERWRAPFGGWCMTRKTAASPWLHGPQKVRRPTAPHPPAKQPLRDAGVRLPCVVEPAPTHALLASAPSGARLNAFCSAAFLRTPCRSDSPLAKSAPDHEDSRERRIPVHGGTAGIRMTPLPTAPWSRPTPRRPARSESMGEIPDTANHGRSTEDPGPLPGSTSLLS